MDVQVSIVIVTHNHSQFIEACLTSCFNALQYIHGEIILVDNCSIDGTKEIIKKFEKNVHIIHNTFREGFATNNNKAIKMARGSYILILNPDTSFSPNTLKDLFELAQKIDNLGLLAPQLVFPNGDVQHSCRHFPTLWAFITRRTPLRVFLQNSRLNEKHLMFGQIKDGETKVDWVLGACMLIPMSVFDKIGLFDEKYFLYVEDIDLCYRIHQAGLDVIYTDKSRIVHHHLAESDHKLFGKRSLIIFEA